MPDASENSSSWRPIDYIVHGQYCPISAIRLQLDRVRIQADASCAILLVKQGSRFFKSLLFVAHHDPRDEDQLQRELVHSPFDNQDIPEINRLFASESGTISSVLSGLHLRSPFDVLAREFGERAKADVGIANSRCEELDEASFGIFAGHFDQ